MLLGPNEGLATLDSYAKIIPAQAKGRPLESISRLHTPDPHSPCLTNPSPFSKLTRSHFISIVLAPHMHQTSCTSSSTNPLKAVPSPFLVFKHNYFVALSLRNFSCYLHHSYQPHLRSPDNRSQNVD